MPLAAWYWILLILFVVFSLWWHWPEDKSAGPRAYLPGISTVLLFGLLFVLGWAVFGIVK